MTYFYGRLFAAEPEISAMFPAAMDGQRHRFYRALYRLAVTKDGGSTTISPNWAARTASFGVRKGHYAAFRTALLAAAYRFTPPGQAPGGETTVREAAGEDAAAAEEPEKTGGAAWLTLHVRAVDGGLISNTLVHHLKPGDTLLLGAAEGRMTVGTASERPVLCLAGGTGLAPLKAIAEAVGRATESGDRRDIALCYGARTEADLYDLPALRRMELDYPWFEVIPATSG
jgi:hypothetical protein